MGLSDGYFSRAPWPAATVAAGAPFGSSGRVFRRLPPIHTATVGESAGLFNPVGARPPASLPPAAGLSSGAEVRNQQIDHGKCAEMLPERGLCASAYEQSVIEGGDSGGEAAA